MDTSKSKIDAVVRQWVSVMLRHGSSFYPVDVRKFRSYFFDLLAEDAYSAIKRAQNLGISLQDMRKLFDNPANLFKMGYILAIGSKFSRLQRRQRKELMTVILEVICMLKANQIPLCPKGRFVVLTENEVKKLTEQTEWVSVHEKDELKSTYGHLNASLRIFLETIYFDEHTVGGYTHGPYDISHLFPNDHQSYVLLAREFKNLRPVELWKELADFPFVAAKSYGIYQEVEFDVDMFGNVVHKERLSDHLISFTVEVNDGYKWRRIENKVEMINLLEVLEKFTLGLCRTIRKMSVFSRGKKLADINFFALKPLKDAINVSWLPQPEVYDRIQLQKIPQKAQQFFKTLEKNRKRAETLAFKLLNPEFTL